MLHVDATAKTPRRANLVGTASYILIGAACVRAFFTYPDRSQALIAIVLAAAALYAAEPFASRHSRLAGALTFLGQMGVMIAGFLVAPYIDTWALVMLPACMVVIHEYPRWTGWIWIGVFSVVMSVMIVIAEGLEQSWLFFGLYIAVYVLFGTYSSVIKRADREQARSDALVQELTQTQAQLRMRAESAADLASMRERNRIARDLHDSVTQTIFSMTLLSESALLLRQKDPAQVDEKLRQLSELSGSALAEMRTLIAELRDPDAAIGLCNAIQGQIDAMPNRDSLDISVTNGDLMPLPSLAERHLAMIVQEALTNVAKHASATSASVSLENEGEETVVRVEDDGIGFDPSRLLREPGHIGLESMKERASEIGARLAVRSSPGHGTTVTIRLPGDGSA